MRLVEGVLVLVAGHVARAVDEVFPAGDALALPALVEPLLVGAGILASVRQPVHGGCSRC